MFLSIIDIQSKSS